jgi:hypothetical protein
MAAGQGTVIADFTTTPQTDISIWIDEPLIQSTSLVDAWVMPDYQATGRLEDEQWVEDLTVIAGGIVANSGFRIWIKCNHGKASGFFNIAWVWN